MARAHITNQINWIFLLICVLSRSLEACSLSFSFFCFPFLLICGQRKRRKINWAHESSISEPIWCGVSVQSKSFATNLLLFVLVSLSCLASPSRCWSMWLCESIGVYKPLIESIDASRYTNTQPSPRQSIKASVCVCCINKSFIIIRGILPLYLCFLC